MAIPKSRQVTVFVIGLRAFPGVPGGVETHAEHLYPLVSQLGHRVLCATRSPYHQESEWSGIRFIPVWAPKTKYFEAIVHSFLSVLKAARIRPDIVHFHAVGPSLFVPLARLVGLKVVVTHHGPDYDREKWNAVAKAILRLGEWCGMKFANRRIVISSVIQEMVRQKYGAESTNIPNGVEIPELVFDESYLEKYGLEPGRYVLMVSRFVPEKRHFDLIDAFEQLNIEGVKLALVGDSDHPDSYDQALKKRVAASKDIVLTGFIGGDELKAIYQHAGVFVLPSSHEGLPISLLEALSFGLRCLASGIPSNRSVGLSAEAYFPLGDVAELSRKLLELLSAGQHPNDREITRRWVADNFDWNEISKRTVEIYEQVRDK